MAIFPRLMSARLYNDQWLCGRFCVQASSLENYTAEKAFIHRFMQQSRSECITAMIYFYDKYFIFYWKDRHINHNSNAKKRQRQTIKSIIMRFLISLGATWQLQINMMFWY